LTTIDHWKCERRERKEEFENNNHDWTREKKSKRKGGLKTTTIVESVKEDKQKVQLETAIDWKCERRQKKTEFEKTIDDWKCERRQAKEPALGNNTIDDWNVWEKTNRKGKLETTIWRFEANHKKCVALLTWEDEWLGVGGQVEEGDSVVAEGDGGERALHDHGKRAAARGGDYAQTGKGRGAPQTNGGVARTGEQPVRHQAQSKDPVGVT
jgi:hypothetical protein